MITNFEDLNAYSVNHHYLTTNESPLVHRALTKNLRIERSVGICSGGEIALFALLPVTRKELVLFDHSYRSIACAMTKYLLIREYGASKAVKLLIGDNKPLIEAIRRIKKFLPSEIAEAFYPSKRDLEYYKSQVKAYETSYGKEYVKKYLPPPPKREIETIFGESNSTLKRYWKEDVCSLVAKSSTKLDKVKFIHGDIEDMTALAPFDLIYLSNAMEHGGRNGRGSSVVDKSISKILRPGGYALTTSFATIYNAKVVKQQKGCLGKHCLWQLTEETKEERIAA